MHNSDSMNSARPTAEVNGGRHAEVRPQREATLKKHRHATGKTPSRKYPVSFRAYVRELAIAALVNDKIIPGDWARGRVCGMRFFGVGECPSAAIAARQSTSTFIAG